MVFFSHGRQAWNEHFKWRRMNVPYNLGKRAGIITINAAFMVLIVE